MDIKNKIPKGYFLTEFDLVNNTNFPVSYNLFDVNTLNVFETQPLPVLPPTVLSSVSTGTGNKYMAYNSFNNTIYFTETLLSKNIYVINCSTNTITSVIPVGTPITGIAYNSQDNTMYVCDNGISVVYVVDCVSNTIIFTISSIGIDPKYITYNSLNNTMYIGDSSSSNIYVIDCSSNTLSSTIPVGSVTDGELVYNSTNNTIYSCSSHPSDVVYVIDCSSNMLSSTIPVGSAPSGVTYNSLNNTVYVSNTSSSDISVINCSTNLVILTINVGGKPKGISYNSILNLVYVANFSSDDVSVINCSTNLVINTITTLPNQNQVVFNTIDNTFYISNIGTSSTISVLSPLSATTTYIGGSFNYNQFLRDIQNNPVLVKDVMFYSSNQSNVNQVFFTAIKDATGLTVLDPKYPQLSVSVNQMQNSISKVDFGENGFVLDVTNSFSGVTVAAQSTLKLILVMKQDKKAYYLSGEDLCSKLENVNKVQYVMGVDNRNNVIHLPVLNFNTEKS